MEATFTQSFIDLHIISEQFLLCLATGPPSSTTDPTKNTQKEPSVGARSGLSPEAMWGIIGACIAIVVVVVVIIVVCCICGRGRCCVCRKGSGASKGKQFLFTYSSQ